MKSWSETLKSKMCLAILEKVQKEFLPCEIQSPYQVLLGSLSDFHKLVQNDKRWSTVLLGFVGTISSCSRKEAWHYVELSDIADITAFLNPKRNI